MAKESPPTSLLDRYRDAGDDVAWGKIAIVASIVLALVVGAAWLLLRHGDGREEREAPEHRASSVRIKPDDYAGHRPEPSVEPAAAVVPRAPAAGKSAPATWASKPRGGARPDQLVERARNAGIGSYDAAAVDDAHRGKPEGGVAGAGGPGSTSAGPFGGDRDSTSFVAGADCQVNAGTAIPATLASAVSTAHGGEVRAVVNQHVWASNDPDCLAIPLGSTMKGTVQKTEVRGQRVALMTFTHITRPPPRNDTIRIENRASDQMGRAGMPGEIEGYFWSQAGLVLASAAIDLGSAILVGGEGPWGILGGIMMSNADRPLNKAARDRLDLPPTILVDPLEDGGNLTLIVQEHINADDFRS